MIGVLAVAPARAAAEETLPVLARVGPWPAASQLIGFRGRLWFANSVKGVNHNSADIHSYDPKTGRLRYERRLFSQDAGRPVVAGGLLYWPFEDSRFSLGWGHFMATDGTRWRLGTIPTARIFHSHAMVESGGRLLAATSAWRAGLQASSDGGRTWRELYDHPTPDRRVSRITELFDLEGGLVGPLRDPAGRRLVRLGDGRAIDLPGWPDSSVLALAARRGRLYGLIDEGGGAALWRSDGAFITRLAPPRPGWRPRALAIESGGFWAVTTAEGGGRLWFSPDGRDWQARYRLEGGQPREVAVYAGRPYVAGAGADGRGVLWGPSAPAPVDTTLGAPPELRPAQAPIATDWAALGAGLERALGDPASYRSHARVLRDIVYRAALAGPPEGFFSERLSHRFPDLALSLIGGNTEASAEQFGRWVLLWGMTLAGEGRVPVDLVSADWTAPPNRSEKYFETAPAAIQAAASIGQDDPETITALIGRLGRAGDPDWLMGDLVGALTVLTGRRFGYDPAAWRSWWAEEKDTWRGRRPTQ